MKKFDFLQVQISSFITLLVIPQVVVMSSVTVASCCDDTEPRLHLQQLTITVTDGDDNYNLTECVYSVTPTHHVGLI